MATVTLDVKVVQHRVRHTSAATTLDVYGHMWPDSDESTRTAVQRVFADRLTESSGMSITRDRVFAGQTGFFG